MSKTVHLGFAVGTGQPVSIPIDQHIAIVGQTQSSGKTTTLQAIASRAVGVTVLAFVTKRGEGAFREGHRVQPYFRDRADWQFVDQLISAALAEKNKWLRQFLIPICRTTKTLGDVQAAIRKGMEKASSQKLGAYVQLDAYLDLIVPEIRSAKLAPALELGPGLNVMDVSESSTPMQMLFVQSALDHVNAHARNTVVVVPEAWEFIPEGKGSPAKASAIALVRKGGGIGNHIWADSQDTAGIDKTILRGCGVWLIGVQREANEIKRNLSNIPAGVRRPKAEEVATLLRGEFFACWGAQAIKVYVQPSWMREDEARAHARGHQVTGRVSRPPQALSPLEYPEDADGGIPPALRMAPPYQQVPKEEPEMCEQHQKLERELEASRRNNAELSKTVTRVEERATRAEARAREAEAAAAGARDLGSAIARILPAMALTEGATAVVDEETIIQRVLARVPAGGGGPVTVTPPEKLRKHFQREEADRIVEGARALNPLAKRVLKLLVAMPARLTQVAIADRLGRSNGGNARATLSAAIKDLQAVGFVDVTSNGVNANIKEKIAADLGHYNATADEVEAVYQAVLYQIATEEAAA